MAITHYLQKAEKFEIQPYARKRNIDTLKKTHVAFCGSLLKHPHDEEMVILIPDPYSTHTLYYEFKTEDISYIENLPSITTPEGETATLNRIWVKKMSVGICCTPFLVEDVRIVST